MSKNLNITKIKLIGEHGVECEYPYSLDDNDWKEIQKDRLKIGYESRNMR